jgi:LPPG:FO 2-phospho-L-lactate transferase
MTVIKIVALAGGVGGAKLADGLAQVLQPENLTIIVNTGDDFLHLGLRISPDIDTVCYTLAGVANLDTGWGRQNETWSVLNQLKNMGMPDWFKLGDLDLATHIVRTNYMNNGWPLSRITQEFCKVWGIRVRVLPMSDQDVQTLVHSDQGDLEFQEYFVHRECKPAVKGFSFMGLENAKPAPGVLEAIKNANAIIFCPSNPWVSIDPILSIPQIKKALEDHIVIAVSPIIGNQTVKGPAAKMFTELGIEPSAFAIAQHYGSIINGLIIDKSDDYLRENIGALGVNVFTSDIFMHDNKDRGRLAGEILEIISEWVRVI